MEYIKKHWRLYAISISIIVFFLVVWLPINVYGSWDFVKSIRSNFMTNVLVPIGSAFIAFIGITISIVVTINQQQINKKSEFDKIQKEYYHQRKILSSEIIGKARIEWLSEFRTAYRDYHEQLIITKVLIDDLNNKYAKHNTKITNEMYEKVVLEYTKLSSKGHYICSFLNPIRNDKDITNDGKIILALNEVADFTRDSIETLLKIENVDMIEFNTKFTKVNNYVRLYMKEVWEQIKTDVNYTQEHSVSLIYDQKNVQ